MKKDTTNYDGAPENIEDVTIYYKKTACLGYLYFFSPGFRIRHFKNFHKITQGKDSSFWQFYHEYSFCLQINRIPLKIIQSCMTLTDMRLTEFMGFTEKWAVTKLFIQ